MALKTYTFSLQKAYTVTEQSLYKEYIFGVHTNGPICIESCYKGENFTRELLENDHEAPPRNKT